MTNKLKVGDVVVASVDDGCLDQHIYRGVFYTIDNVSPDGYAVLVNGKNWSDTEGAENFWLPMDTFNLYWRPSESVERVPEGTVYSSCDGKDDTTKTDPSMLMRGMALPLRAILTVLAYGAQKYAANSWQTVPNGEERYEAAMERHLMAWREGEFRDKESGLPHLFHAACNMMFLMHFLIKSKPDCDLWRFNKPERKL